MIILYIVTRVNDFYLIINFCLQFVDKKQHFVHFISAYISLSTAKICFVLHVENALLLGFTPIFHNVQRLAPIQNVDKKCIRSKKNRTVAFSSSPVESTVTLFCLCFSWLPFHGVWQVPFRNPSLSFHNAI